MTVEGIVNEVIKRLKALENRNNLLIVYHENTSILKLEEVLRTIDKRYLKIGIVSFKDPAPLIEKLKNYEIELLNLLDSKEYLHMPYLLNRYDGMLVSSMTIGEMYNLSVLNTQEPLEQLTINWLTAEGKVYVIDTLDLQESKLKSGLIKKLNTLKMDLEEMGIAWIGQRKETKVTQSGLLTKDDLIGHEGSKLFIPCQTVVTPMARDYAKAQKISIERK